MAVPSEVFNALAKRVGIPTRAIPYEDAMPDLLQLAMAIVLRIEEIERRLDALDDTLNRR